MRINKGKYFGKITGYKMPNGHFELGSSIHIQDYYYLKRLFYNSFFTNRFAFLVCKHILLEFRELIERSIDNFEDKDKKKFTITLLGYEDHSELLVSNVRKMLNDYLKKEIFNHDIFTKKSVFLKNPDKIGNNIISIFPISTTFSTSVKIQSEISEILKDKYNNPAIFHSPIINCFLISNKSLKDNYVFDQIEDPEYAFGWLSFSSKDKKVEMLNFDAYNFEKNTQEIDKPNNKSIDIEDTKPSNIIQQKFLINLTTKWSKIDQCKECFPEDPSEELFLIESNKNPVTPNLIFGYPKTFPHGNNRNIFRQFDIANKEPIVYRKHIKKYDNHFIYYIRIGKFLQENKTEVIEWLHDIKSQFKKEIDKNIVIITPNLESNSGFVNVVNDIIFSDTATILQYNPTEEYLQNFKMFYSKILEEADHIFFVDDVLSTTKSVININFYLKNILNRTNGIDYTINLINRTEYYSFKKLMKELGTEEKSPGYFFSSINVPPVMHKHDYPYSSLSKKFRDLSLKSSLDNMRIYFRKMEEDFKPINLSIEFPENIKEAGSIKSLFQFLLLNEFNNIFVFDPIVGKYTNEKIIYQVFEENDLVSHEKLVSLISESNSIRRFLKKYPEFTSEVRMGLYKICTSEPYIHYYKIKEAAFKWVLNDLVILVRGIEKSKKIEGSFFEARNHKIPTKYSHFESFKFLLKRAIKLKLNYVYSLETLYAIKKVIKGIDTFKSISYYKTDKKSIKTSELPLSDVKISKNTSLKLYESRSISSTEFNTYYVGLLQELIVEHESKALQLVVNIKRIVNNSEKEEDQLNLKNSYNDNFVQLLRLLVLENTFIFESSCDKFLAKLKGDINFGSYDLAMIKSKLTTYEQSYSFQYAKDMLSSFSFPNDRTIRTVEQNILESFEYMVLLKALLKGDLFSENDDKPISIRTKIENILKLSCNILNISQGGAYFAVKHQNLANSTVSDDITIVGEYCNNPSSSLASSSFDISSSILLEMFKGINDKKDSPPLSMFELTLGSDNKFHYKANTRINENNINQYEEICGSAVFKNYLFIKVSDISVRTSETDFGVEPLAVICFYNNKLDNYESELDSKETFQSSAKSQSELDFTPKSVSNTKTNYERFDPKRIRQLLLLRRDLREFIQHHFNNDSLRAYIEMINKNNFYLTLKHGTDVYESVVEKYIKKIASANEQSEKEDLIPYLQNSFNYLTNKLNLLSQASQLYDGEAYKFMCSSYKISEVIEEFQKNCKYVLLMNQSKRHYLKNENQIHFNNKIDHKYNDLAIQLPQRVLKELTFELLYNIKKHCVSINYSDIFEGDKIIISLAMVVKNSQHYLIVSNNHSSMEPSYIQRKNGQLSNRKKTDGLNLIYNIIYKITGVPISIGQKGNVYSIYIPLKLSENEKNSNN